MAIFLMTPSSMSICEATPSRDLEPTGPNHSQSPVPSLNIELGPPTILAEITDDSLVFATFEGTVHVEMPRGINGFVTMQHDLQDEEWNANIDPQSMEFQGPGSEPFALNVFAPRGVISGAPIPIMVTGYLKLPGLAPVVAHASVQVGVEVYLSAEVTSKAPVITVNRGDTGDVELVYTNTGNSDVEITILFEGDHEGVDFEFPGEPYQAGPGGSTNVTVRARVGNDAPMGDAGVTVYFYCTSPQSDTPELVTSFDITVNVPTLIQRMGGVGFVSLLIILAIVGVGMYFGWRKGKLTKFSEIKTKFLKKKNAPE